MEVKMAQKKVYDKELKVQAVKLGREIGFSKAAKELGINVDTLYGWSKAAKEGRLDLGLGYPHSGNRNEPRRGKRFFRSEPSEVSKGLRMRFLERKMDGGRRRGKIAFLLQCAPCFSAGILLLLKTPEYPQEIRGYCR